MVMWGGSAVLVSRRSVFDKFRAVVVMVGVIGFGFGIEGMSTMIYLFRDRNLPAC